MRITQNIGANTRQYRVAPQQKAIRFQGKLAENTTKQVNQLIEEGKAPNTLLTDIEAWVKPMSKNTVIELRSFSAPKEAPIDKQKKFMFVAIKNKTLDYEVWSALSKSYKATDEHAEIDFLTKDLPAQIKEAKTSSKAVDAGMLEGVLSSLKYSSNLNPMGETLSEKIGNAILCRDSFNKRVNAIKKYISETTSQLDSKPILETITGLERKLNKNYKFRIN